MTRVTRLVLAMAILAGSLLLAPTASATPVCTEGFRGGPDLDLCGGRTFPEAQDSLDYVQFFPDPNGFREYRDGLDFLAEKYPTYLDVFTLKDEYGDDAVSAGFDGKRSTNATDSGDGHDIIVARLTDESVSDTDKQALFFSLSVHGDERGGLEGGVRALEDLLIAATSDGSISDGTPGYTSTTGTDPEFNTYKVADVLKKEIVYFVDFNVDGWTTGERNRDRAKGVNTADPTKSSLSTPFYTRENAMRTDLNRQMPTVGWINSARNPLEEPEMYYGHKLMHEVAAASLNGQMAYGADVHGEAQSRAWVDIMYPAGQFDSVKHRQHMSIAQRTKSVIDETLFLSYVDQLEEVTGGDGGEGVEDNEVPIDVDPVSTGVPGIPNTPAVHQKLAPPKNSVPTKPARWGTVWDTLGYTDTGFIGDYLAGELGVTGMDYEIFMNHSDASRNYGRWWSVVLQENYINATRAIVKTAMAYAMTQTEEFADFKIDPGGKVGYLYDPVAVTDSDSNGSGTAPGPKPSPSPGIGANGLPVAQQTYSATNMQFFEDEDKYVVGGLSKVVPSAISGSPTYLDQFDTLVIADSLLPQDASGNPVDEDLLFENLEAWVRKGGNLVLTDHALHALEEMDLVPEGSVQDIFVYQPYSNFVDFDHPMLAGLRGNARQLSEATLTGYKIPSSQTASVAFSPMSIVTKTAFTAIQGHIVGTTGNTPGTSDDGTKVSVGEIPLDDGQIRIMGGGLAMPTEEYDHRYGLKDYALTYSGLYIMENSIKHDSPVLGAESTTTTGSELPGGIFSLMTLLPLGAGMFLRRKK